MKNALTAALLLGLLAGCKSLVEDLNVDPNNPQTATAITMLTGTELANIIVQEGETARRSGIWNGYFQGQLFNYQSHQQYSVGANDFNDPWSLAFAATLKNARLMRQKALEVNNRRLAGVAQVLEANAAGTATALWGDIPFREAYNPSFPNPRFDPQPQVYGDLQTLLDSAIVNLNSTAFLDFAGQDIQFQGNVVKWRQVAYTLKARYYLHSKQYAQALAAAQNGVNAAANSLLALHLDNANGSNLYHQFLVEERVDYLTVGPFAVSLINPTGTRYRGHAKTIERARYNFLYSNATTLNTGADGVFARLTPFPLVSYQENLLILAECDARVNGFAAGLARLNGYRVFLAAGGYLPARFVVAANLRYDPFVAADFAAGGLENPAPASLAPERALLREIVQERYVTFFGQNEGFNDTRRTQKEPDIRVPLAPNVGTQLPQRFLYPQTEVDRNSSTPGPIPGLYAPTPVNR